MKEKGQTELCCEEWGKFRFVPWTTREIDVTRAERGDWKPGRFETKDYFKLNHVTCGP